MSETSVLKDMMPSGTDILLYFFVIGSGFYFFGRKRKPYPPGPTRWPIFGNIFGMDTQFYKTFQEHAEKYGPISSLKLGLEEAVVLHETDLIKEAFSEEAFAGRPVSPIADFLGGGTDGILQSEGRVWSEQRKFTVRTLRDFGFGKIGMEGLHMKEVQEVMDWLKNQDSKPANLHMRINIAVINALWAIMCGERYAHDDPQLVKILDDLMLVAMAVARGSGFKAWLILYFPSLAKMLPNWSGWGRFVGLSKVRTDLFDRTIEKHRQNRSKEPRDYIDVYLKEIDQTEGKDSIFHESTGYKALQSVMSDFFLAGSDTTATNINWAILYLITHPRVLKKLQQELDCVVGKSRSPKMSDRASMPYMEAFMMETLRYSTFAPISLKHAAKEDALFHGYFIPKGTVLIANVYKVHFDSKIWGDPTIFRPERFLSQDGLSIVKNENYIPFSYGKRACPGYTIAVDQMFLFVTSLVQRFDISAEPGKPLPTLEPKCGLISLRCHPYNVVAKPRN